MRKRSGLEDEHGEHNRGKAPRAEPGQAHRRQPGPEAGEGERHGQHADQGQGEHAEDYRLASSAPARVIGRIAPKMKNVKAAIALPSVSATLAVSSSAPARIVP